MPKKTKNGLVIDRSQETISHPNAQRGHDFLQGSALLTRESSLTLP